jgi:hypothetical protein
MARFLPRLTFAHDEVMDNVKRLDQILGFLIIGILLVAPSRSFGNAGTSGMTPTDRHNGNLVLLPDDRLVVGRVEEVTADQVKVNTGEMTLRYLPLKEAIQNGVRPLIRGDLVEIWVNNQDLVVDYHPLDTLGWHRIIRGSLAQHLGDDQEWAVIRNAQEKEEAHAVRPLARSTVAALPIGSPALFLIDRANKIVDATFGNEEELQRAANGWQGSPPENVDRQVPGSLTAIGDHTVTIRAHDGKQQTFEVRSFIKGRLTAIPKGTNVILLVDNDNKVTDVAVP